MNDTITVNQTGSAANVTGVEIEKGTKGGEYILLTIPGYILFNKEVKAGVDKDFREMGGQWLGMSSKWRFPADKEMEVRRVCTSLFGWHCWKDNGLSPAVKALMEKPSGMKSCSTVEAAPEEFQVPFETWEIRIRKPNPSPGKAGRETETRDINKVNLLMNVLQSVVEGMDQHFPSGWDMTIEEMPAHSR